MGNLKVGVHRDTDGASWMMVVGEKRPGVVVIPPTLWHGARNRFAWRGDLTHDILDGWWTDAGTFESLLRAANLVADGGANLEEFKEAAPMRENPMGVQP